MRFFSKKALLVAMVALSMGTTYALPLGNPADPTLYTRGLFLGDCNHFGDGYDSCNPCSNWLDSISVRVGYYGDFVYNAHLKRNHRNSRGRIDHTRFITNAGLLALNFCDRIDLFTTLGSTYGLMETRSNFPFVTMGETSLPRIEAEFDPSFSWSVGARATIWECGCTTFGIEGQYFHTHAHLKRLTVGDLVSVYPNHIRNKYHEGQIGIGVAHRIHCFVPYLGVKWSHKRGNLGNPILIDQPLFNTRNARHWGFCLGVTLLDCDIAGVTVEGRWGDEKALHVNGQVRF